MISLQSSPNFTNFVGREYNGDGLKLPPSIGFSKLNYRGILKLPVYFIVEFFAFCSMLLLNFSLSIVHGFFY